MKTGYLFLATLLLNLIVATFLYFNYPELEYYFLRENSLIENLSAFFYFSASILSFYFFLKNGYKVILLAITFLAGMAFLDEISFGKYILNYNSPEINGKKIDACHDLIEVFIKYLITNDSLLRISIALILIIGLLIIYRLYKIRHRVKEYIYQYNFKEALLIGGLFFILIFVSQIIDMTESTFYSGIDLTFYEELLEMNAGLSLIFLSYSLSKNKSGYPLKVKL